MSAFMPKRKCIQLLRQPMAIPILLLTVVLWTFYMLTYTESDLHSLTNVPISILNHRDELKEAKIVYTQQNGKMQFFLVRLNTLNSLDLEPLDLKLTGDLTLHGNPSTPDVQTSLSIHDDTQKKIEAVHINPVKLGVPILDNKEMNQWYSNRETYCDDQLQLFNNNFVHISNAVIDTTLATGRKGGEEINNVINQEESKEYYILNPGFFKIKCNKDVPNYTFSGGKGNHLTLWLQALKMVPVLPRTEHIISEFTIAITRYEYANLYHTMTDFYNAFLVMKFFNHSPEETNVLFIDGHPSGALDPVWKTLFNSSEYVGRITTVVKYRNLAWGILGYSSPMHTHTRKNIPYIGDFSQFFLKRYNISSDKIVNCNNLTISFIWRRDYLAHPRNPTGFITRKIKNEKELLNLAHDMYPSFTIKGSQIDLQTMRQQLQYVSNSDILIGMHGAGLTHTLFLPKHAGLIEFYPTYWGRGNIHFQTLSRWRGLHYTSWQNKDKINELPNKYTYIPPSILKVKLEKMVNNMCPKFKSQSKVISR